MQATISISDAVFDPGELLAEFTKNCGGAGAIASFTGLVRADEMTQSLTLSHYPGFTEARIETILEDAFARWPLLGCRVHHRTGEMKIGEAIVFVAAAAKHRRDAFEACDFVMDYLKSEAPFWKQESTATQTHWIEPREADYKDKERWSA